MPVPKELLEVLACPKCRSDLVYDRKNGKLTCNKCKLKFGVIDGDIPNMLIGEAEKF